MMWEVKNLIHDQDTAPVKSMSVDEKREGVDDTFTTLTQDIFSSGVSTIYYISPPPFSKSVFFSTMQVAFKGYVHCTADQGKIN